MTLKKGGNALGHAAYKNNSDIVQYLLENNADPNDKDNVVFFPYCCE